MNTDKTKLLIRVHPCSSVARVFCWLRLSFSVPPRISISCGHAQVCRVVSQCDISSFGGGSAFEEVPQPGSSQDDGRRGGGGRAQARWGGDHLQHGRERQSAVPAEGRWRLSEYAPVRPTEGKICGALRTALRSGGRFVEERKYRHTCLSGRISEPRRTAHQSRREDHRGNCMQRCPQRGG